MIARAAAIGIIVRMLVPFDDAHHKPERSLFVPHGCVGIERNPIAALASSARLAVAALGSCLVIEMNQLIDSSGGRSRARNWRQSNWAVDPLPERRQAPRHGRAELAARSTAGPRDMK
jgi:hypothetical protein